MFEVRAPLPIAGDIVELPNPQFSDSESNTDEVATLRAIDGTLYTYVKKKNRRRFQWEFVVVRLKGLEFEAFVRRHLSHQWEVVDHNGRTYHGYLVNNPFEIRTDGRAGPATSQWPRGERQSFTVEFEGVEQ